MSNEEQKPQIVVLPSESSFGDEVAKGAARQLGALAVSLGMVIILGVVGAIVGKKPEDGAQ